MTELEQTTCLAFQGEVLAFSGHRPDKISLIQRGAIWRHMDAVLKTMRPREVISGLALGVDTWAAVMALNHHIPFVAAIPFEGQDKLWPLEARRYYAYLREHATRVQVVCQGGYHPSKMRARNEWMCDNSKVLVAYWNGSPGGTANCVTYARKKMGLGLLVVDPTKLA